LKTIPASLHLERLRLAVLISNAESWFISKEKMCICKDIVTAYPLWNKAVNKLYI